MKNHQNFWHYIKKYHPSFMLKTRIDYMRSSRECRHCGREFYSMKDEFCSFDCVIQTST